MPWIETTYDRHKSSFDFKGRKATKRFIVHYDEAVDVWTPVLNPTAVELPALGDVLFNGSLLQVVNYVPQYDGNSYDVIYVDVEYEMNVIEAVSPVGKKSFDWRSATETEEYYKDVEGNRAINAVGDPLPENPKRKKAVESFTMTKYVAHTSTRSMFAGYNCRVNNGPVTIDGESFAAGMVFIESCSLGPVESDQYNYQWRVLKVDGQISRGARFDEDKYENRGFRGYGEQTEGEVGDIYRGEPPAKVEIPWPLDDEGNAAATADVAPTEITLKPYYTTAMGGLFS